MSSTHSVITAPPAILLCAGYGTRMAALTKTTPKPLLKVAGRPVLDYLLDLLLPLPGLGKVHVVSNSHYVSAFNAWADGWNRRLDPAGSSQRVVVHDDGSRSADDRLGAIGDLAFVVERLRAEAPEEAALEAVALEGVALGNGALVAAGDNIFRFPLTELWDGLTRRQETSVLALHEPDRERLQKTGVLELDASYKVLKQHEKPQDPPSSWACPSIYGLRGDALAMIDGYLGAGHSADEIGLFIAYLVEHQTVRAIPTHGERLHVGSPESLRHADAVLKGA